MEGTRRPIKKCRACGWMNDPEADEEWQHPERFREDHGDDDRVIFAQLDDSDYCPQCSTEYHSEEEFPVYDG